VAEGVPTVEMAAVFGCSTTTIKHRIIDHGIRVKGPHRHHDMRPEQLAEMLARGMTVVKMAEVFECHHSVVSARIRRLSLR
jgi:hypothetical protein